MQRRGRARPRRGERREAGGGGAAAAGDPGPGPALRLLHRGAERRGKYFCWVLNILLQVREEAYTGGGEEYLTFSSCPLNTGGAMDNKSGIFTVPVTGR